MSPDKTPHVVVDTGTLLTLLLGGESSQSGFSYAKLLCDAQKKGLIHVTIPDMVASEFCGINAPLIPQQ